MSNTLSKKKKNDKYTILWALFRDLADEKLKAKANDLMPSNREYTLEEAQKWMDGDYSKSIEDIDPPNVGSSLNATNLHDNHCPIKHANGYLKKRDKLASMIKIDPRWIFDPCSIELYFNACAEQNFRFFQVLGESLLSNELKNRTRNDQDHLTWFVHQRLPLLISEISRAEEKRKSVVSEALDILYVEVKEIMESNSELHDLLNLSLMKKEGFKKTCKKWIHEA